MRRRSLYVILGALAAAVIGLEVAVSLRQGEPVSYLLVLSMTLTALAMALSYRRSR